MATNTPAVKTPAAVAKSASASAPAMARLQSFWSNLRPQQRIYLGVGIAVTLAVLAFFAKTIATPDMKPLVTGLEAADAQTLSAQLTAKKIPFQLSPDGKSILVPSDQVDAARLEVASHDSTHSGRMGFEIFDKVSWGQTEFDEKVNYQRALEGELERTIQTMSDVKSARVHLVMATDSVFMDRERSAKGSVTLRLKRGSLSREQLTAISRLVAGAVDELKPADVAIIDADSNQALGFSNGPGSAGGDGLEQELNRRLIATLSPVVGVDRIRSSVNVEYETGSSEESQEKYDPAVSAPLNMQSSEENIAAGASAGGVPGTSSNVPSPKQAASATAAASSSPGQSSKTQSATYGVNKITRHTIEPAGRIRRITAALLVDDAVERKQEKGKWVETRHKRQPADLKLIGELAQAAIGFDAARGDVISVQNLTFDQAAAQEILPATLPDKIRSGLTDYASAIRYGALLILFLLAYLLMIKPLQKRAFAPLPPVLPPPGSSQHALPGHPAAATPEAPNLIAERSQVLKKQLSEFIRVEPDSSTNAVRAWLHEDAK
jgi:flagellar M-ring protein FliF